MPAILAHISVDAANPGTHAAAHTTGRLDARRLGWLLLMAVAGLFCSGCAFGDRYVQLDYKPIDKVTWSQHAGSVAVVRFTDGRLRDRKQDIGEVRNGYGMVTAQVRIDKKGDEQDIEAWFTDALSLELERAGLTVKRCRTMEEAAGSPVIVTGRIDRVWVTMYMTEKAEIESQVVITLGNHPARMQPLRVDHSQMAWLASGEEYREVLRGGLQHWTRATVQLILDRMDGKPEAPLALEKADGH